MVDEVGQYFDRLRTISLDFIYGDIAIRSLPVAKCLWAVPATHSAGLGAAASA